MNRINERKGDLRAENRMLHKQLQIAERRLSYAADKQLLLLNRLIDAEALANRDDARGKPCPSCQGPLISFATMNLRICGDCNAEFDWHLAPGQKPLLANNRVRN